MQIHVSPWSLPKYVMCYCTMQEAIIMFDNDDVNYSLTTASTIHATVVPINLNSTT